MDSSLGKPSSLGHLSAVGKWRLPHQPGQAAKAGSRLTEGRETLGPCVSALDPPRSSGGTHGALHAAPPFSFYAAMFLCCQVGPLGPFGSAWGRGRVPAAPCLGPHLGTWTTSALRRALFPACFPRARSGQLLPGTVSRLSVEEKLVLTPPPWGPLQTPPPLPRGAQGGRRWCRL